MWLVPSLLYYCSSVSGLMGRWVDDFWPTWVQGVGRGVGVGR